MTLTPLTINGNNRRAGLTYIFIIDFVLIGLIFVGYFLYRNENFMEIWNLEPIIRYVLPIGMSLSATVHFGIYAWLAIKALQPKTVTFGPQKVSYLINESMRWEVDYPRIKQVEVQSINRSGSSSVLKLKVITLTAAGEKINSISQTELSPDKLAEIVKAFRDRQIRVVEI